MILEQRGQQVQKRIPQVVVSLILSGCLAVGQAAPAAIGVALANGSFQVDREKVSGNATIFEGTQIQNGAVPSELRLNGGSRLSLGSGASGRVFRDHLLLEKGEGRFAGSGDFAVRAGSLNIRPEGAGVRGAVQMIGSGKVQVAALAGAVRVTNAQGVLVARLHPGTALEFEPQAAGATAPVRLSGCLQKKGNRYLLTDETTNVTVELEGSGLDSEAGNRVEIVGAANPVAAPAGASQSVRVAGVKRLAKGCSSAAGKAAKAGSAAAGAGAAGAAATAGGISGATVAVIGGVAAAATVGGLAAAEKLPGQGDDDSKPSASR